ncbi:uncharacterized protein TRIVIDRAFT_129829, partial [Trichoderma virens Gv29-8]
ASALASIEKRRRDFVRSLGPCPSGCHDLDKHVLLGGLERGSVVGISAEDEDGVGLGLQVLVCSLLDKVVHKVQIITPKPPSTIVVLLKNSITAELRARGITALDGAAVQERDCLNRIMLSRVFDMDGLCEVLADLDDAATSEVRRCALNKPEVGDAQPVEKTEAKTQLAATPNIILITHFSSLLTSFFTQRDNSAAHATLRLLASRLRRLSRTLSSSPLILLINSTDSGATASTPAAHFPESHSYDIPPPEQPSKRKPSIDPTLRSIFNPASPSSGHASGYKLNKPTFGLVFTQLLDIHLLCTRAPRPGKASLPRALTLIEVLLDDIGLWEGERGLRRRREQRWTVVAPYNGRI